MPNNSIEHEHKLFVQESTITTLLFIYYLTHHFQVETIVII